MNILDLCISVVITLFILSMVTEKFTQLIKNYALFFNFLFAGIAVALLLRGVYLVDDAIQYKILVRWLGWICLVWNLVCILAFGKKLNVYWTLGLLIGALVLNVALAYLYPKGLYLTIGSVIGYFALATLVPSRMLSFRVGSREYDTRFFKRINKPAVSGADAPKRDKEVTVLSFLSGLFIAYLFHADFLEIISSLPHSQPSSLGLQSLNWGVFPLKLEGEKPAFEGFEFDISFTVGIMLTGFFLSFGSKFFHDLLEMLFYAKKAKLAIADEETYKKQNVDEVIKWVEEYDIEKFYLRQRGRLMANSKISAVAISKIKVKDQEVDGILVYSSEKSLSRVDLDALFIWKNANGIDTGIPYQLVVSDVGTKLSGGSVGAVDEIANAVHPASRGSVTCEVDVKGSSSKHVLACFHVVKSSDLSWEFLPSQGNTDVISNNKDVIGEIVEAGRNVLAEAALIRLDKFTVSNPFYPKVKKAYNRIRPVVKTDNGMMVYMYSRILKKKCWGFLKSYDCADKINYGEDSGPFHMQQLLMVVGENGVGHIQEPGDSGNLLFDAGDYVIGVVFARKEGEYTLAFAIDNVIALFADKKIELNLI